MKKFSIFLSVFLVILLGGAVAAPYFLDVNQYKPQIVTQVKQHTGLDVQLDGNLALNVLPMPYVSMNDVSVSQGDRDPKQDPLLKFQSLDVYLNLMPLFSGNIVVEHVTLVKPEFSIMQRKDGSLDIPSFSKVQNTENEQSKEGRSDVQTSSSKTPNLSLNQLSIKDGIFKYTDQSGSVNTIENVNADIKAGTLNGPFSVDGSVFYDGYAFNIKVDTEQLNSQDQVLPLTLSAKVQPLDLLINFGGVVSFGEEPSAQGKFNVKAKDINATISTVTGVDSGLQPVSTVLSGIITADSKIIDYKNFAIYLGEQSIYGSVRADLDPLSFAVSLRSPKDLDLSKILVNAPISDPVQFNFAGSGTPEQFEIKQGEISVLGQSLVVSGKYSAKNQIPSAKLAISSKALNLDKLLKTGSSEGELGQAGGNQNADKKVQKNADLKNTLDDTLSKALAPMDIEFLVSLDKVIYAQKTANAVVFSANLKNGYLQKVNFKSDDLAGAKMKVVSDFSDYAGQDRLNAYIELDAKNIRDTASFFDVDPQIIPEMIKSLAAKIKLEGSLDEMDMTSNMQFLDGELIAKGKLKKPLDQAGLDATTIQFKHPNTAKLLSALNPEAVYSTTLKKPMDVYFELQQSNNIYTLNALKADLAGIVFQGNTKINVGGNRPKISGDLKFGDLNVTALMGDTTNTSAGGKTTKPSPASPKENAAGAKWSKEPIDMSVLHTIDADITLTANSLKYTPWTFQNTTLALSLLDGNLQVKDFSAATLDGNINGTMKLETVEKERHPLYFETDARFQNINLEKLVRTLAGSEIVRVKGTGNMTLAVKTSGASQAALIKDLNGSGTITGANIILEGVDVTEFARALSDESKPGDSALSLWRGASQGGQTAFETLDGAFAIQNGIVNLQKLDLDGTKAAINTTGNINLPLWTLDTKHNITVKPAANAPAEVPPFEVSFSGSLDNPAQTFGQGLLQDYLNRKIQRKVNKLIADKIGVPSNDNNANATEPASGENQTPKKVEPEDVAEEAIKGLLQDLLR
ncbi:MAG: AsmA family protein [Alphaproteobacteria bacterium]|nr:AsmA family protein [Alphaproteobacteria bacterium]